jgi:ribosomal-protein-alanine N-acetyltransferase
MHVDRATARDAERISELARLGETTLDPVAELAREWSRLWVVRASGKDAPPSGFLLAWDAADEVHLIDLVVHPDERRRGIARRLCSELFAHVRARRARCLLLEVRRSNGGALALYRALGLRAVGVRKGYYSSNGEDAIEMQLDFDPESGAALPGSDEIDLGEKP